MEAKSMNDHEAVEMMRRASSEIKQLRATIARLAPEADAYRKLSIVLELLPRRGEGMSEDVANLLDRRITSVQAAIDIADAVRKASVGGEPGHSENGMDPRHA